MSSRGRYSKNVLANQIKPCNAPMSTTRGRRKCSTTRSQEWCACGKKKFAPHTPITDITSMGFLTSTTSISGLLLLHSTNEGGMDYTSTTIHPHQERGMVYQGALICHKDGWWFQTNNYKETTRKKGWIVWYEGSFRGVLSI